MGEIKQVRITTSSPADGDPGHCEIGYFKVTDGAVQLCNEDGVALSEKTPILAGESAELVASRLLRKRWLSSRAGTNFNRPIGAVPRGIA
jgi:hypothetical protein